MKKFELKDTNEIIENSGLNNNNILVFNPELALILGDNELAIIVQQIHYWLTINKKNMENGKAKINTYFENRIWCFQTYEELENQFYWMSYNTLRRKIKKLEQMGILITGNFNKFKFDHTKWYTIDYNKLSEIKNNLFRKKIEEKNNKTEQRKKYLKLATEKFKLNKLKNKKDRMNSVSFSNLSEMPKTDISTNAQNEHFEMLEYGIAIQDTNIQENNYKQENNYIQSVSQNKEERKKEFQLPIFDSNFDEKYSFILVNINSIFSQKTVTISNKKISVNEIMDRINVLLDYELNYLIDYTYNVYNKIDLSKIKNIPKYINAIFINALFEEKYLDKRNNNFKGISEIEIKNNSENENKEKINYKQILEYYKLLVDYDDYVKSYNDEETASELINIIVDMATSDYTFIHKQKKDRDIVKGVLNKLNFALFEWIICCLKQVKTKINNPVEYCKTLIYNECLASNIKIKNDIQAIYT